MCYDVAPRALLLAEYQHMSIAVLCFARTRHSVLVLSSCCCCWLVVQMLLKAGMPRA
jgi:hypothetical protein